jgi:hypothetical protein
VLNLTISVKPSIALKHLSQGTRWAVLAMLSLWLGLCALDLFPELHRLLHQDAQNPSHNCVVTQLQHHLLLPGLVAMPLPPTPTTWGMCASNDHFRFLPAFDYVVSDGRAPPSFASSTAVVG